MAAGNKNAAVLRFEVDTLKAEIKLRLDSLLKKFNDLSNSFEQGGIIDVTAFQNSLNALTNTVNGLVLHDTVQDANIAALQLFGPQILSILTRLDSLEFPITNTLGVISGGSPVLANWITQYNVFWNTSNQYWFYVNALNISVPQLESDMLTLQGQVSGILTTNVNQDTDINNLDSRINTLENDKNALAGYERRSDNKNYTNYQAITTAFNLSGTSAQKIVNPLNGAAQVGTMPPGGLAFFHITIPEMYEIDWSGTSIATFELSLHVVINGAGGAGSTDQVLITSSIPLALYERNLTPFLGVNLFNEADRVHLFNQYAVQTTSAFSTNYSIRVRSVVNRAFYILVIPLNSQYAFSGWAPTSVSIGLKSFSLTPYRM